MRYKILLSYLGTNYCGWQKQPGEKTVQQTVEEAFSTILREPIEITGCGRTDTGVHARGYAAHFDANGSFDLSKTVYQVNSILPFDISIWSLLPAGANFHARFNAIERGYQYSIHLLKDPFLQDRSFFLNTQSELDQRSMEEVAQMVLRAEDFQSFCKTGSGNNNYKCSIKKSEWQFGKKQISYSISANRFLRGMVRLIVGASLNAGLGKLSLEEIKKSLREQTPLPLQWSVPPEGLCFQYALYPVSGFSIR